MEGKRLGVVLFQLGGPDRLEAIEPFLYNLFCDPDIVEFPFARVGRKALAKLLSTTRAKKVQHHYSLIGGASPIRRFTEQQAWALQRKLRSQDIDAYCFVAMRYWHPFTAEAVAQVERADCDHLVLLPLYPQYSSTTTGSSLNEWNRQFRKYSIATTIIEHFYRNRFYIDALVERIDQTLRTFDASQPIELVFSAHSVPVAVVERGDPYQRQIEETVALVMQHGGWEHRHRLCYQSKIGASKWLQPPLRGTVRQLASEGAKQVCVVPISFVSDHVETLAEIEYEAREQAHELGIWDFKMMPGLNDSPRFIAALAAIVLHALDNSPTMHAPLAETAMSAFVAAD